MRRIKYRVWDKRKKRMHYSCIDDCVSYEYNPGYFFVLGQFGALIKCSVPVESLHYHEIPIDEDSFIVLEFTGLKDKNNKEIYEGDIMCKTPTPSSVFTDGRREHISVVSYIGSGFKDCYDSIFYNLDVHDINFMKVIGNIYENQELLQQNNLANQ